MMLDSTAAVAAERQGKNARQLLESVALKTGDEGIAVSVVTVLELAHGITRSDTTERRDRRQRFLDELLTGVPIQPVTVTIALRAGQIDVRILNSLSPCLQPDESYPTGSGEVQNDPKAPPEQLKQGPRQNCLMDRDGNCVQ
jgi:predicted nucleic acid-binding protein